MKIQANTLLATLSILCAVSSFAQSTPVGAQAAKSPSTSVTQNPLKKEPVGTPVQANAKTATSQVQVDKGVAKVWVNKTSKVYHCEGSKHYGKTKGGEFMAESDAKAKGYRATHGKTCG